MHARLAALLALCALAAPGCRSAAPAHAHGPSASNRDPHGPADVASYIARLEDPERLRDLDPEGVVATLAPAEDAWIADIGCGPGIFALAFAQAAPRGIVFAVDVEPKQLDRLREHLSATGADNVVPVLASLDDPHLPAGRFDLVFVGDTYHHFGDRVAYARALRELLRPDGRLALLEYKPGPLPVGPPPEHKLAPGELERELEQAGYELVARHDGHRHHDFQVWRPRR